MKFHIEDWGLIEYTKAYNRQKQIVIEVINGAPDRLIFCEHPPVITLGRMTKPDSLLFTQEQLQEQGIQLCSIDRGGDITLHAPGQLIVYPIFNLNKTKDLHVFMVKLEQVAIDLLHSFGILALSVSGQRGVFIDPLTKIVSIGTGVRKWVTYHGLGINVNTDLSLFRFIRPCGLSVQMTSMTKVLKTSVDMADVKAKLIPIVERYFHD